MILALVKITLRFRLLNLFAEKFVSVYLEKKNVAKIASDNQKKLLEEAAKNELKKIANGKLVAVYPIPKR